LKYVGRIAADRIRFVVYEQNIEADTRNRKIHNPLRRGTGGCGGLLRQRLSWKNISRNPVNTGPRVNHLGNGHSLKTRTKYSNFFLQESA